MIYFQSIDEVKGALESGRLKVAFKKVKDLFQFLKEQKVKDYDYEHIKKNFTLLSAEFHFNDEKRIPNISDDAYLNPNRHRIALALIEITDELTKTASKVSLGNENRSLNIDPNERLVCRGADLHGADLAKSFFHL